MGINKGVPSFNYKDHYERDADRVNMLTGMGHWREYRDLRRFQTILDSFPRKSGLSVLDIGCGDGAFLAFAASRGFKVAGLEISEKRVRRAKIFLSSRDISADVVVGDVNKIPFRDKTFNAVVASEVVEHLPVPLAAVSEMRRVSKPGGLVLVAVPYKEKIISDQCIHCGKLTPRNGHLHSFDISALTKLLENAGLKDVSSYRCVSLRTPFWGRVGKKLPYFIWKLFDRLFTQLGDEANWIIARGRA